jgi:hypothetical protein
MRAPHPPVDTTPPRESGPAAVAPDVTAASTGGQGGGAGLPRLVALEELAERGLWTRDGAYRALRRSGLPYLLLGSRMGPRRRLHRRVAVSERTAAALLSARVAGARRRGLWTPLDFRDLGLPDVSGAGA